MTSPLRNAIDFFEAFGLFDVVFPFLLVFSLIFAILEKTRLLGTEADGKTPKKNIDAMVAFVVALLVVATNKVVTAINEALPNVVLLLVGFFAFILLTGLFVKSGELSLRETYPGWHTTFVISMFIILILIFLNSIKTDSGQSWLSWVFGFAKGGSGAGVTFGTIILVALMITFMVIVTKGPKRAGGE